MALLETDTPQTMFTLPKGKNHTVIENVFARPDSLFTAWNTKADGSGTTYAPGANIANIQADMTLYAQWKRNTNAIHEVEAGNSITIYPNPTKGKFSIDNGQLRIDNWEILDVCGRIIVNCQLSIVNSIDISHLPSGIYYLRVQTDKGVITRNVVKN